jgi:putative MATE family efflux protein
MDVSTHPLAVSGVGRLLFKYAAPSIVSMLVGALYNIVDQIFIGHSVGILGNAATNVTLPLVTICMSVALLIGVGGASNFNLEMGRGHAEKAARIAANAISFMAISGLTIAIIAKLGLRPMLLAFGGTEEVMPYAAAYASVISLGMPFLIMSVGGSHLIRADGSPRYSMFCNLLGAVMNVFLNWILMFKLGMGIAGAAWGTTISLMISWSLSATYAVKFRSADIRAGYFMPNAKRLLAIASLGLGSSFNQLAMMCVQVTLNNTLTRYGALSIYGANIPLAAAGIITKVNMIFLAFVIGLGQGGQPVIGFNYGAGNYSRVKRALALNLGMATIISVIAFICFQLFPKEIIKNFGEGSDAYYHFVERYFRIFLFMTFVNGIQPVTAQFFTSIGKAVIGLLISLTRQILFLLPLVMFFPRLWGIDGIMYAGPVADSAAALLAFAFIYREVLGMKKLGARKDTASR